jgi:hypothetical protein
MERESDSRESVAKEKARKLAFQSLALYFHPESMSSLPDKAIWSLSNLPGMSQEVLMGSEPLEIYDLDRRPLFWQWLVRLRDGRDLVVRSAADDRLGSPVVSVFVSHKPGAVAADFDRTRQAFTRSSDLETEVWICFEDPRIGLLVEQSGEMIRLIELGEEDILTFHRGELPPSPLDSPESPGFWNGEIQRLERFWVGTDSFEEAASRAAAAEVPYQLPGIDFVYQINDDYCAPATAEMILGFHKIKVDQIKMADYMDTVASDPPGRGGTGRLEEVFGYEAVLGNGKANRDEVPEFLEAKLEIGDSQVPGRPLKVSTNKHAMAASGWLSDSASNYSKGELYLYDPKIGKGWRMFTGKFKSYVFVKP